MSLKGLLLYFFLVYSLVASNCRDELEDENHNEAPEQGIIHSPDTHLTPDAIEVMNRAYDMAKLLGHPTVSYIHVAMALSGREIKDFKGRTLLAPSKNHLEEYLAYDDEANINLAHINSRLDAVEKEWKKFKAPKIPTNPLYSRFHMGPMSNANQVGRESIFVGEYITREVKLDALTLAAWMSSSKKAKEEFPLFAGDFSSAGLANHISTRTQEKGFEIPRLNAAAKKTPIRELESVPSLYERIKTLAAQKNKNKITLIVNELLTSNVGYQGAVAKVKEHASDPTSPALQRILREESETGAVTFSPVYLNSKGQLGQLGMLTKVKHFQTGKEFSIYDFDNTNPNDKNNYDSYVSALLPKEGSETVYTKLSNKERKELITQLSIQLSKGNYDDEIIQAGLTESTSIMEKASDLRGFERPILPVRYLQASSEGKTVGVCRHSAVALSGLLLELGYPSQNIHLLATENHVYVRIKIGNEDLVIDPTPGTENVQSAANYQDNPEWAPLRPVYDTRINSIPQEMLPSSYFKN